MTHVCPPALRATSRFGAAILGGYLFAFGFVSACTLAGFAAGLTFSDAQTLSWMLGFLVYLGAMLGAFAPRSSVLAWSVLAGGGALMSAAAWTLSRMISA